MDESSTLCNDWPEVNALRGRLIAAGLDERDLAVFDALVTALRSSTTRAPDTLADELWVSAGR